MLKTEKINAGNFAQATRPGLAGWIKKHYTRQSLWSLFLMCAFPLHAWTLILAFRDVSWVTDRTNSWDAVGVVSYGLMFTLVESLIFFVIVALLGYLVSTRWDADHRVALLAVLALMLSLWAILEQMFFLIGTGLSSWIIDLLIVSGHPLRTFYMLLGGVVTLTVLVPALLVLRSQRAFAVMRAVIDRLSILTMFYLVLDVIGVVIVLARNIF